MIERSRRPVAASRIASIARDLLEAAPLCAIATVGAGGRAYVNTAYFAWSPELEIVWLSEPRATHSRNLRGNDSAAIAVYDSRQTWGEPDRGIQLFGTAGRAVKPDEERVAALYAARFPAYEETGLAAYRLYLFRPRRLKLFDERSLGAGTFVTARLGRDGRPAWEKTEIYRSG